MKKRELFPEIEERRSRIFDISENLPIKEMGNVTYFL